MKCQDCDLECEEAKFRQVFLAEIDMTQEAKEELRWCAKELAQELKCQPLDIVRMCQVEMYEVSGGQYDKYLKIVIQHQLFEGALMLNLRPDHWWYKIVTDTRIN